ncbi:MAG: hypothetical protein ACRDP6_48990 [Actinoallomurus sp.]
MKPKYAWRAVPVAITATLLCAAACGGSGGTAASHTSHVASPVPAAEGTAAKSATVILAEAHRALAEARSVHVKGSVTTRDGRMSIDVRIGPNTAIGKMTIPVRGQMVTTPVRSVGGKVYNRSRRMALIAGGPEAAAAIGDRWVYSKADSTAIRTFLTTKKLADILTITDGGQVSKGNATTINGIPVITLVSDGSVLYVATTGAPRPVRLAPSLKASGQRLDFSEYDVPFTVTVPSRAVDLSPH